MASLGMDPASAVDRLGHTDGGALFLCLYRHLYEGEKRRQADLFGARVQELLDEEWTGDELDPERIRRIFGVESCTTVRN